MVYAPRSQTQLEKGRDELTQQNLALKSRLAEVTAKIGDPAATFRVGKDAPGADRRHQESFDRHMRNLEAQLEDAHKKLEATERFLLTKEEECGVLRLDFETLTEENRRLQRDAVTNHEVSPGPGEGRHWPRTSPHSRSVLAGAARAGRATPPPAGGADATPGRAASPGRGLQPRARPQEEVLQPGKAGRLCA